MSFAGNVRREETEGDEGEVGLSVLPTAEIAADGGGGEALREDTSAAEFAGDGGGEGGLLFPT